MSGAACWRFDPPPHLRAVLRLGADTASRTPAVQLRVRPRNRGGGARGGRRKGCVVPWLVRRQGRRFGRRAGPVAISQNSPRCRATPARVPGEPAGEGCPPTSHPAFSETRQERVRRGPGVFGKSVLVSRLHPRVFSTATWGDEHDREERSARRCRRMPIRPLPRDFSPLPTSSRGWWGRVSLGGRLANGVPPLRLGVSGRKKIADETLKSNGCHTPKCLLWRALRLPADV